MKLIDRFDAVAKKLESLVAGNASSDPLYLTNRTIGQKLRLGLLIGAPVLASAALIYLALDKRFDRPLSAEQQVAAKAAPAKAAGEITAKVLPNVEKDFTPEYSRDIEVLEASVSRGADRTLSGKLRNNTDHIVRVADVVFDVTDEDGSQLGGVAVRVENIAARSVAPFKVTVEQRGARSALVRELHSR